MIDYYPHLIEFSIEFKRFSRKYLADLKSKVVSILIKNGLFKRFLFVLDRHYAENESARFANVADGYQL